MTCYIVSNSGEHFYTVGTAVSNLRNPGTEDATTYYKKKAAASS